MRVLLLVIVFFSWAHTIGNEDILCTSKSCKDAVCAPVHEKCNQTSAGVHMLSPDICNCCEFCLVNLGEGEQCSVGDPSNAKHTFICGPGLACTTEKATESDGTCQKMQTRCAREQQDYDGKRANGTLGSLETRAICDDDGLYGTYKCIPGHTCYCLHSNGSRIFGEADYNTIPNYMDCSCSRAYYDASDIIGRPLQPHEHFRCSATGSYDHLQCMNEKCLCVDSSDGAPTYPNDKLIDLEKISNTNLPCYTSKKPGKYYEKCEEEYQKVRKEIENRTAVTKYSLVLGYSFPRCDLDGTYSAVQENKTHKFCVDKDGQRLTEALDKSNAELSTWIDEMNCKCVRANLITTTNEKLKCDINGNYATIQCRRGICRCVDSDGNQQCGDASEKCQEVDERNVADLSCP